MECKANGVVCRMVAAGEPCLGPVTQAGCGTLCPGINRGCYGCFGPMETPNTAALAAQLAAMGKSEAEITRLFRSFNANAEAFRKEGDSHG
jgi:coenzyme F420-reducing hydrogenase gamma subunit